MMSAAEHLAQIRQMTPQESEEVERRLLVGMAQRYGRVQDALRREIDGKKQAAIRRAAETVRKENRRR